MTDRVKISGRVAVGEAFEAGVHISTTGHNATFKVLVVVAGTTATMLLAAFAALYLL